jgi:hypothetical protein
MTRDAAPGRQESLYAPAREVASLEECRFYHTMDVPGYGLQRGEWDLRGREPDYLGGIELDGKTVLEIGPASGFLTFWMERQGAEVVAYDLSPAHSIDVVPYARVDHRSIASHFKEQIARQNNAFWLAHEAFRSRARVVYGTVYDMPAALGMHDVATLGSVLLHLRDPFLALQNVLEHTRETVVVTDKSQSWLYRSPLRVSEKLARALFFRPMATAAAPEATWWRLTPELLRRMAAVLGFEEAKVTYHRQRFEGRWRPFFTLVARRTVPMEDSP